jgi:hypothetical protein
MIVPLMTNHSIKESRKLWSGTLTAEDRHVMLCKRHARAENQELTDYAVFFR